MIIADRSRLCRLAKHRHYTQNPSRTGVNECNRLISTVTPSTFRVMQKKSRPDIGRLGSLTVFQIMFDWSS